MLFLDNSLYNKSYSENIELAEVQLNYKLDVYLTECKENFNNHLRLGFTNIIHRITNKYCTYNNNDPFL
jgi:hypothetical protein